ncbi:unnamed protein product, partial [Pocillopora meandrina]
MTATQITEGGTQTKTIPELACSRASDIQPYAYYFSTIHILLSLTATLGNSLILVALSKESSLHPPSKALYRCLATTDLFVVAVSCLMISFASYTKIFRALRLHHTQIQDHDQQHPSQPNALNIARYRKAVYNALWVQLALFVCYL